MCGAISLDAIRPNNNNIAFCPSLTVAMTKNGYRSTYDVTRPVQQSFNNVELVVASWTTLSSVRGTITLMTDGGPMNDLSETVPSVATQLQGYDRYNMTPYFENVRRRLSTSNHQYRLFAVIIRLKARLQPSIGFTLRRVLAAFTRSAITPPNRK